MEKSLIKLADQLVELRDTKNQLAKDTKDNNAAIDDAQQKLWDAMVEAEMSSFAHNGKSFSLSEVPYASPTAGRAPEVYVWMKENGYADLVKETINAQTFAATVREMMENPDTGEKDVSNIPEDLVKLLTIFPKKTVSITKK